MKYRIYILLIGLIFMSNDRLFCQSFDETDNDLLLNTLTSNFRTIDEYDNYGLLEGICLQSAYCLAGEIRNFEFTVKANNDYVAIISFDTDEIERIGATVISYAGNSGPIVFSENGTIEYSFKAQMTGKYKFQIYCSEPTENNVSEGYVTVSIIGKNGYPIVFDDLLDAETNGIQFITDVDENYFFSPFDGDRALAAVGSVMWGNTHVITLPQPLYQRDNHICILSTSDHFGGNIDLVLLDSKNRIVASDFDTEYAGMLLFKPEANEVYRLKILMKEGAEEGDVSFVITKFLSNY